MKFGKEFASQMVQEWQEAYMDYNSLKLVLKDILHFKQRNKLPPPVMASSHGSLKRRISLYRAFSGLTSRHKLGSPRRKNDESPTKNEDEVILVSAVQQEGSEKFYQTTFLMSSDNGGEYELVFFRRLDDEFNKVLEFYKAEVEQVLKEAQELNKQMDALIALRIKVENPEVGFEGASMMNLTASVVSSPALVSPPIKGRNPGQSPMDVIQEVEMSSDGLSEDEKRGDGNAEKTSNHKKAAEGKMGIVGFKPASLEILNHVKINVTAETPKSTLKGILVNSKSNFLFNKEELRKAEELMKRAFIEFYQKLRLLKSYSFLNQLAFSKIMKKYDKITSRNASKAYLEMVDNSCLGSSDEVTRLLERVEATFVKHFSNGNRRKGMNSLRPKAKKERHRITFFLGFFSGCTIALIVATVVLVHARNLQESQGRGQYMETIFPLYSLFGYIVLHMLMYSANIYFWRHYRVNYQFIFGFKQGTELGYREVFLLSSGLAVLTLAGVISNLDMDMDHGTQSFRAFTELVPLGLVLVVLLITICPFNVIYRSSRFFLIKCAFHCICAPLYKVVLPDFFLAGQLTSQVQALRSLEIYVCYYGWGNFKTRTKCNETKSFEAFYFVVTLIPFWLLFLQSLRRLFEEKSKMDGLNSLKFFSVIVAVAMRTGYERTKDPTWKIMAATSSAVTTIGATYWDIVIDWGLLQRHSRNPWLRDKLLIENKKVYFIAMVLNCLLRLAWMQSVLGVTNVPFLHRTAFVAFVACLEILRRGIWNFFRLENEHLYNVGMFRAFKSVPLPFNYDNNEEDKDL